MKYEFHVGDYVETNTGTIGFVSEISGSMFFLESNTSI